MNKFEQIPQGGGNEQNEGKEEKQKKEKSGIGWRGKVALTIAGLTGVGAVSELAAKEYTEKKNEEKIKDETEETRLSGPTTEGMSFNDYAHVVDSSKTQESLGYPIQGVEAESKDLEFRAFSLHQLGVSSSNFKIGFHKFYQENKSKYGMDGGSFDTKEQSALSMMYLKYLEHLLNQNLKKNKSGNTSPVELYLATKEEHEALLAWYEKQAEFTDNPSTIIYFAKYPVASGQERIDIRVCSEERDDTGKAKVHAFSTNAPSIEDDNSHVQFVLKTKK